MAKKKEKPKKSKEEQEAEKQLQERKHMLLSKTTKLYIGRLWDAVNNLRKGYPIPVYFSEVDLGGTEFGAFHVSSSAMKGILQTGVSLETLVGDFSRALTFVSQADYSAVVKGVELKNGQLILDDPGVIDLRLYSVKKAPVSIAPRIKEEPAPKKTLKEIYKIFTEKKAIYGEEFKRLYLQYYSKAQHPAVFWGEENAPSNLSEFINNAYLEFSTNHLFRHRWYGTNPVGLAEGLAAVAMLMTKSDFAVIKTGYAQGENGHKIILPDSQVQVKVYKQREPAKIPDSNVLN